MKPKQILIVEDDPLNMKLVRTILSFRSVDILEATEAETGLSLAEEHHPDLILMDIQLPGMDGLSATRRIKNQPDIQDIPIVALTSHAMEGDEQKAIAAGCDAYITKPIRRMAFLEIIDQYLGQTESKPKKPSLKKNRHQDRILIVDDEPLNIKLIAGKLHAENYEILTALSGKKALKIIDEHRPDIILLDIMMPDMNGYEVTRRLKSNPKTAHIPIILVTALNQPEHKQMGMKAGADEFLNKPVNTLELLARVKSLIRLNRFHEQLKSRIQTESLFTGEQKSDTFSKKEILNPSVLLIEDSDEDIRLMRHYLSDLTIRLHVVKTGEDALNLIVKQSFDVVLLDIFLPGMDGFELCQFLKEKDATRNIQIVVISASNDLDNKIRCIELGSDDFLVKPVNRDEIKARIRALIKKKEYMDRLSMKYENAIHAAMTDKLTGLFNQAFFKHSLDIEIKRIKRHHQALGLLMVDVDNFKQHNDTFGHQVGDDILHDIGTLIKTSIREVDLAARYGGEEFAVLLPYVDKVIALEVAERVRNNINSAILIPRTSNIQLNVTVSIGIALIPSDAGDAETLIKHADIALYKAKHAGKNQSCYFKPGTELSCDSVPRKEVMTTRGTENCTFSTTALESQSERERTLKERDNEMKKKIDKRFGTVAIEKGYITHEQMERGLYIQQQEDEQFDRHRLIGQILVSEDWITETQVEDILETMSQKLVMAIGYGR